MSYPDVEKGGRYAETLRRRSGWHQAVGALRDGTSMQGAPGSDPVLLAHRMDPSVGPRLAGPGPPSFGVEPLGDLMVGMTLRQLAQPRDHAAIRLAAPAQRRALHDVGRRRAAA